MKKKVNSKAVIVVVITVVTTIICTIIMLNNHDNDLADEHANQAKQVEQADEETTLPCSSKEEVPANVVFVPIDASQTPMATAMEVETTSSLIPFTNEEIDMMAKILYNEANCVGPDSERSMVIWTILNRYDVKLYGDTTIAEICTRPRQFAYDANTPITDRNYNLVMDVVQRWADEKAGKEDVGRTLPPECLYFLAASDPSKGEWHNTFYSLTNVTYGDKVEFGYENPLDNPYN